jgi:DUF971 family protein
MNESVSALIPQSLQGDEAGLVIAWSDGRRDRTAWTRLRDQCPCATCRVRRAEPPPALGILSPEETAPLHVTGMHAIGNYAYQIEFSDGHKSGIYSLDLLRSLGDPV